MSSTAQPTGGGATGKPKPEPAWGAWVVIAGLVAVVAIFVVATLHYKTAAEVTTAVGAVSGVIAALVGAYFGIGGKHRPDEGRSVERSTRKGNRRFVAQSACTRTAVSASAAISALVGRSRCTSSPGGSRVHRGSAGRCWSSRRKRFFAGVASLFADAGPTGTVGPAGHRSTGQHVSWYCDWRARTPGGAVCASRGSSASSVSVLARRRSGRCSDAPASGRRRDAKDHPGRSSCAPRRRAFSRAISSPSIPPGWAGFTCSSSSSLDLAASTSPGSPPTPTRHGRPAGAKPRDRRATRERPLPDPRPRRKVHRTVRGGVLYRGRTGDQDAGPRTTCERRRGAVRAYRARRVPRPHADHRASPSPAHTGRLRNPLQHWASTPFAGARSPRPRLARGGSRLPTGSRPLPRPPRRADPRLLQGSS